MTDRDLIDQLAAAVAARVQPRVPLDVALWSVEDVANYLNSTPKSVCNNIMPVPGFPAAIRLPTKTGGRGHPMFKAAEVIAWAESYQERRVA